MLVADTLAGNRYRTNESADVVTVKARSGNAARLLVVFPGFIMPGAELAEAFAPHLGPDDAMIVVQYAQRGVDVDQIYASVMREAEPLAPERLVLYGASMGGMCAKQFLDRYHRDREPYGRPALVLDTAPAGAEDVRRPGWLLDLGDRYHGGPLTSAGWRVVSALSGGVTAEPGADAELIARARRAGATVGMPAITTQGAYIGDFPELAPSELVPLVSDVHYLRGRPPRRDPLVDVDAAVRDWRRAFPPLRVVTVPTRRGDWHVPLIERPAETMGALAAAGAVGVSR